jgi:hypothetical protein
MASSERTEADADAASATASTVPVPSPSTPAPTGREGVWPRREAESPSGATTALDGFRVDCLMNARYHSAREAFLDSVHRWLMLGIIIFGSAVVLDLFGYIAPEKIGGFIKMLFAALPVIFGTLDLTFDLSNRARAHGNMKRRYCELLADVAEHTKSVEQADATMHRCSADEEPAYHALLATAWNAAQEMVHGDHAKHYELSWWNRFSKQVLRFEGSRFPVMEGASS